MSAAFAEPTRLATVGVETEQPHNALAGACIKLALADADAGSVVAYRWLQSAQCRHWCAQLGGDGYLDAALSELGRQFRRFGW